MRYVLSSKLTGYRKEILNIISGSTVPLTVRDIYDKMQNKPDYSTVYRAMDYFVKKHNVKHITFCDNVKLYFRKSGKNAHFLHCTSCHKTIQVDKCFVGQEEKNISEKYDFKINDHFLYFMGICSECRSI